MTPLEILSYLKGNPITSELIRILNNHYIDADGYEIDLQDLESFVFHQRNQFPDYTMTRGIFKAGEKGLCYKRIGFSVESPIEATSDGLQTDYLYERPLPWSGDDAKARKNSVRAWIDEDEYSDTYGKKFLDIRFQSIELIGDGGVRVPLEDYYYNFDNAREKVYSWIMWDARRIDNHIRLEYDSSKRILALNNPPRYKRNL